MKETNLLRCKTLLNYFLTILSPYDPDANSHDYTFWVHIERKGCCVRHINTKALKATGSQHCDAMTDL
uniref:Uncharacterized protein n=1 Tax=Lepeophtheirus salmonis TaxID=72036 RepID=A0A0K2UXV1_LEPSM